MKTKSLRDEIARGAGDEILPAAGRNPPPVLADGEGEEEADNFLPREGRAWYDAGMYIQDQLQEIKANIAAAEERAGREPGSVKLLAVSKTFPVEDIMQAYADGQRLFGENRLQEAMGKIPEMPADCEWHLIGSCATLAKEAGKKVGIITTVTTTHATPAGFYARGLPRGKNYRIAADLVNSGFDFFAGGGLDRKYNDKKSRAYKNYGNIYDYAKKKGYNVVTSKKDFLALKPSDGKVLTRFTDLVYPYDIDITSDDKELYPTLAQLLEKRFGSVEERRPVAVTIFWKVV